jgi:hypothetical protein
MVVKQKSGGQLLTAKSLSKKQQEAITRIYEADATLVIAPTGVGKTTITLHAIQELLNDGEINRAIVCCPAKVCSGWVAEALKWQGLNIHVATGTGLKGARELVDSTANVLVMSYESVHELVKLNHGCDAIVFDEITRLKSSGGKAFKALRYKMKHFSWRIGLSATPLSENWQAVYAISLILDDGQRFGRSKDKFMQTYFFQTDFKGYSFELRPGMGEVISKKFSDLIYIIPESHKRETLPEPVYSELILPELPESILKIQSSLIKDNFTNSQSSDITAVNAAVVSSKLRQLAQGFVYSDDEPLLIWDERFDAFQSLIDERQLYGAVVATFEFSMCVEVMLTRYPNADVINGKTTQAEFKAIAAKWANGEGDLLFLQVRAGSHGLDFLQFSSWQMVHFAPIWSRDAWLQLTGRLDRTGQTHTVEVTTLIAPDSIDEMVRDRVITKSEVFRDFLSHLI